MFRWEDFKADLKATFDEFKRQKIGWIGVGLITFMVLLGLLAPYIAPGVPDEWARGNERWDPNPAHAPPAWVDWITREDHFRQTEVEDWDHRELHSFTDFIEAEAEIKTSVWFPDTGNVTIDAWHEDEGVLDSADVEVKEREPVEDLTVTEFTAEPQEPEEVGWYDEPLEESPPNFGHGPVDVEFSALITNEGAEDKNITLEMPDGIPDQEFEIPADDEVHERSHIETFRLDGLYAAHLGEKSRGFEVGVGGDVAVETFDIDVDEEDNSFEAFAEVRNLVDERRDIRMRLWEKIETDGDYEYDLIEQQEMVELGPNEDMDLTWDASPPEGLYSVSLVSEEIEVDLQEEDEPETTAAGTSPSLSSSESEENEESLAQQDYLDADIAVDDEVIQGEFLDVSVEITNTDEQNHTVLLRVQREDEEEPEVVRSVGIGPGGEQRIATHRHTFTFDLDADRSPREIYLDFSGHSDLYRRRRISVERPDSDELSKITGFRGTEGMLELEELRRGDREGEFRETISVYRRMRIRDNVRDQVSTYFDYAGYEDADVPPRPEINPVRTIFGQPGENWLRDPEVLNGEYKIHVDITAVNLGEDEDGELQGLDDATVHLGGSVYGIFGTDRYRRDIFLGWLWGARYGLYAGGVVALTTIIFSTSYGMTSAYYGGWVDEMMSRLQEILMGIPTLPILIILLRFWNQSINVFVLVYALLMWRGAARVIRARGLQVAQDTYIEAAESLGSGSGRIIFSHMIPQILPYSIAQAALIVPVVIMAEAGMHILGLGDPYIVTWGTILNEANQADAVMHWQESWFWVLFPGIGMMIIGFGFIATGMAIERIINPEMQQR